jgi:hypothetical protein
LELQSKAGEKENSETRIRSIMVGTFRKAMCLRENAEYELNFCDFDIAA